MSGENPSIEYHNIGYRVDVIAIAIAHRSTEVTYTRLPSSGAIVLHVGALHRHAEPSRAEPRKSKVSRRRGGGGSVLVNAPQRYCMQSSHLQVSIPRMHLCEAYLSSIQRSRAINAGESKGSSVYFYHGYGCSLLLPRPPPPPVTPFAGNTRASRGETQRARGNEWDRVRLLEWILTRVVACFAAAYTMKVRDTRNSRGL